MAHALADLLDFARRHADVPTDYFPGPNIPAMPSTPPVLPAMRVSRVWGVVQPAFRLLPKGARDPLRRWLDWMIAIWAARRPVPRHATSEGWVGLADAEPSVGVDCRGGCTSGAHRTRWSLRRRQLRELQQLEQNPFIQAHTQRR